MAPYSYDWLDNCGRRSPRELTPGAEELRVGQTMITIFELVSVDPGRQWTGVLRDRRPKRLFGNLAVTYAVEPDPRDPRLVCRIVGVGLAPAVRTARAGPRLGRPGDDAQAAAHPQGARRGLQPHGRWAAASTGSVTSRQRVGAGLVDAGDVRRVGGELGVPLLQRLELGHAPRR